MRDNADMANHEVVKLMLVILGNRYPVPPIPVQAIDENLEKFRAMYDLTGEQWELVSKVVKSKVKVTMDMGTTLAAPTLVDWMSKRHSEIDWKRWVAYKHLLISKGFAPNVLATLDDSTAEIVNCAGDPSEPGAWKRRGLVIGDVQSGKTATYLGAVNRAADAGYKLVILLAGGTEALRKQTQFRVDEGLLGRDTSNGNEPLGVAAWQGNFISAQAMTTQETDFRKTSKQATSILVDPDSPTPLVFVIKKNKTALENVRDWIAAQRTGTEPLDVPMLLIDDESDYASVNTKDENSPTAINGLIREILALAGRTSYLAFTATPFANVFIDHETVDEALGDDLFPNDYIRTLDAPSNYSGSTSYFGTEDASDSSRLVSLDDADQVFPYKHKSQLRVDHLPESLLESIRYFVLASAVREARKDSSPRAMLINVSRFKHVQAQVHGLVEAEFERVKAAVELHAVNKTSGAGEHGELRKLRETYERQLAGRVEFMFEEVQPFLSQAVHGTGVRLINSERVKRAKDLGEVETDRMIAVGGDVLSRGLTLEGLTVSYFHRLVGASDTLLQMARWFGYRPGYEDLCRVWIPDEVADQFRYVDGIVGELRGQLRVMKKQGLRPRDFGLRVRMHPESLLITARNKMKSAEAKPWTINVAGARNLETVRVDSDPRVITQNQTAVGTLVTQIEGLFPDANWAAGAGTIRGIRDVPRELIAGFLDSYVAFVADPLFADSALAEFVRTSRNPDWQKWTVAFVPGSGAEAYVSDRLSFKRPQRSVAAGTTVQLADGAKNSWRISGSSSRLAGSNDVARAGQVDDPSMTEPSVYGALKQPVLLIYLVEPRLKTNGMDGKRHEGSTNAAAARRIQSMRATGQENLVGVKVGVPGSPGDKGADVKYMLNTVAMHAWSGVTFDEAADDPEDVDGAEDE